MDELRARLSYTRNYKIRSNSTVEPSRKHIRPNSTGLERAKPFTPGLVSMARLFLKLIG